MIAPGPTISVVITSCNQLNSLRFTLATLKDQRPDTPHEVIVVDQGSDDGTVQFLASVGETEGLRTITDRVEAGRTAARNRGARASRGHYLMFLDPGVVLGPLWWQAPLRTLDCDPLVGAAAGKVLIQDGRIDHAGQAVLEWRTAGGVRLTGRSIHAGRPADTPASSHPLTVQGLAGEALMVRASAFFAVGGFDEGLGREFGRPKALADAEPAGLDLCLRLGHRGWSCVYRPESIVTRLRVAESKSDPRRDELTAADDLALLTANWQDRVRPDFIVPATGAIAQVEDGNIRPYVEPAIRFPAAAYHAGVNPGGTEGPAIPAVASVIVLTHNALDYTRLCVEALLEHTDPRHELIFVDNGSRDGTPAYLQGLERDHAQVRVILNETNAGFAAGNNQGLAAACGRHLVLLNSDTVVTAGWLDALVGAADRHPRAGLLGAVTNNISGLQRLARVGYDEDSLSGLAQFAARHMAANGGRVERTLRLTGFCLLVKRELVARLGGLDEAFGRGNYEDNDYCLRAHLAGYECLIVQGSYVHHFGSRSFIAAGIDYAQQIQTQWAIFKNKWGIPAATPFNAPVDLSGILAAGYDAKHHFQPLPEAPAVSEPRRITAAARS